MYKKFTKNFQKGSFKRRTTDYFVTSLAFSDVLCSLISLPVFVAEMFVDFTNYGDLVCQVLKYTMGFFPVVRSIKYLCLAIERFMIVYFPYAFPSNKICKRLIVAAWFISALLTIIPMPAMTHKTFSLPKNKHTMFCMYDNSNTNRRMFFISFISLVYFIPFLFQLTISVLIIRKMRQQRLVASDNKQADAESKKESEAKTAKRFKNNYMFIIMIIVFMISYLLLGCYKVVIFLFKLDTGLTIDYGVRMVAVSAMYINGAVSSTILFCCFPHLRKKFFKLFRKTAESTL